MKEYYSSFSFWKDNENNQLLHNLGKHLYLKYSLDEDIKDLDELKQKNVDSGLLFNFMSSHHKFKDIQKLLTKVYEEIKPIIHEKRLKELFVQQNQEKLLYKRQKI